MFVTDDNAAKQTFLRHIQKDSRLDATTEHMWSKNNGNQSSPMTRRIPSDEAGKPNPEMSRLMNASVDENSANYPTVSSYLYSYEVKNGKYGSMKVLLGRSRAQWLEF